MNSTYIDKLAFIDIKDRRVLETRSRGKDKWYIPGGKREAGETDQQALSREIQEELSVKLIPHTIKYFGTFEADAHGKPAGTKVRMTCYTARYEGELKPANEVEEFTYFSYERKAETSAVDNLIFDHLKENDLID